MRVCILFVVILLLAVSTVNSKKNNCEQRSVNDCNQTDYQSYIECVRKRMKRSTCDDDEDCSNCSDSCSDCDCDYCQHHSCDSQCNSCCSSHSPCTTHHCCHKTCHMQCKTVSCRRNCRKDCTSKISQTTLQSSPSSSSSGHNITTVINLRNVINNTNLIDMPVLVNNTNVNNITLQTDWSSVGGGGAIIYPPGPQPPQVPIQPPVYPPIPPSQVIIQPPGYQPQQPCCNIISPRQCTPIQKFPFVKCYHLRTKKCGSFCSAPIVHEQPHQICDEEEGETSCHKQIVYIPQPQPKCWSTSSWPYVSCGIQKASCEGCYSEEKKHCSQACYDDGYDHGPMYRKGPFYRQGYSPVPSCLQTGSCGGGFMGGYNMYPALPIQGVGYSPDTYESNYIMEVDPNAIDQNNTQIVDEDPPLPLPLSALRYPNAYNSYGMIPPMSMPMPYMSMMSMLPGYAPQNMAFNPLMKSGEISDKPKYEPISEPHIDFNLLGSGKDIEYKTNYNIEIREEKKHSNENLDYNSKEITVS